MKHTYYNPDPNPLTSSLYQERLISLKQQLLAKQSQYLKKKQAYQEIIATLQHQNSKLKQLIHQNSEIVSSIEYREQVNNSKRLKEHKQQYKNQVTTKKRYAGKNQSRQQELKQCKSPTIDNQNFFTLGQYQANKESKFKKNNQFSQFSQISNTSQYLLPSQCQSYQELRHQNNILRQQLTKLNLTYQKQIEQLTFYFEKIKNKQKQLTSKKNGIGQQTKENKILIAHYQGQIKLILDSYQNLLKDFAIQRGRYKTRIQELARYGQCLEQKILSLDQELNQIELTLKIKSQQNLILLNQLKKY